MKSVKLRCIFYVILLFLLFRVISLIKLQSIRKYFFYNINNFSILDDSDHYYESLHPTDDPAQSAQLPNQPPSSHLVNTISNHIPRRPTRVSKQPFDQHRSSQQTATTIEEDYDSFDSDEDISDSEEVRKNDSGVDVSNNRLPDPPTPTNQVYAFMQKIRNFGSLSKNLSKLSKKNKPLKVDEASRAPTIASKNLPQSNENTTFYVNVDLSQSNKDKKKIKTHKASGCDDPYENTEFHAPRRALSTPYIEVIVNDASTESPVMQENNSSPKTLTRKKSKSEKSLKSKFRKSMGHDSSLNLGTSFNGTRSTFYISDSADIDSGVFTNSGLLTPPKGSEPNLASPVESSFNSSRLSTAVSPEVTQRKSSLTIRPNIPPPPPPIDRKSMPNPVVPSATASSNNKRLGTTSWYAECGVFKLDALKETSQLDGAGSVISNGTISQQHKDGGSSPSWYADAGLYQTSGASVASSSGSSGVSTGGSGDDHSHSMFLNEPLYQIYSAAKLEVIK